MIPTSLSDNPDERLLGPPRWELTLVGDDPVPSRYPEDVHDGVLQGLNWRRLFLWLRPIGRPYILSRQELLALLSPPDHDLSNDHAVQEQIAELQHIDREWEQLKAEEPFFQSLDDDVAKAVGRSTPESFERGFRLNAEMKAIQQSGLQCNAIEWVLIQRSLLAKAEDIRGDFQVMSYWKLEEQGRPTGPLEESPDDSGEQMENDTDLLVYCLKVHKDLKYDDIEAFLGAGGRRSKNRPALYQRRMRGKRLVQEKFGGKCPCPRPDWLKSIQVQATP